MRESISLRRNISSAEGSSVRSEQGTRRRDWSQLIYSSKSRTTACSAHVDSRLDDKIHQHLPIPCHSHCGRSIRACSLLHICHRPWKQWVIYIHSYPESDIPASESRASWTTRITSCQPAIPQVNPAIPGPRRPLYVRFPCARLFSLKLRRRAAWLAQS